MKLSFNLNDLANKFGANYRKVLIPLLWKMKKVVKILIAFLSFHKKKSITFFFNKKFLKLFVKSISFGYQLIFSINNMIHLHLIT